MAKKIYSTPLAGPKISGSTEHSANLKSSNTLAQQAAREILAIFDYLYRVPLAPIEELSTKDVCVICKGHTDTGFPMCETARSRVRLANCGDILCLGCLSRSAFSQGNQCPHCQKKFVQDGQVICCNDEHIVDLVWNVEFLKGIGLQTAKEATHNIFATAHSASTLNSRKSVVLGAYWVAVAGDVAGKGVDRAKLRRKTRHAILGTVVVLCIGLALLGILVPYLKGNISLAILVLLMYVFGIRLSVEFLKAWWFLFHMS